MHTFRLSSRLSVLMTMDTDGLVIDAFPAGCTSWRSQLRPLSVRAGHEVVYEHAEATPHPTWRVRCHVRRRKSDVSRVAVGAGVPAGGEDFCDACVDRFSERADAT